MKNLKKVTLSAFFHSFACLHGVLVSEELTTNLFLRDIQMGYPCATGNRSFRCNGDLLRFYRDRKGLTQSQLASEAGYSVRLVGKAEAGQPIRMETVEVLAEALSRPDQSISPIDLMTDPIALAKKYVFEQNSQTENFVSRVDQILSRNFELRVIADLEQLDLASVYRGSSGLREYRRRLHSSINGLNVLADSMRSQFFALGNEVVVWYQPENPIVPGERFLFRPITKLRFSGGLLVEQEDRISLSGSLA